MCAPNRCPVCRRRPPRTHGFPVRRDLDWVAARAVSKPGQPHDPLFLTGLFSCLNRLLNRPLADILATMPIADEIRQALLERSGPYAPLLAVAEQSEALDQTGMVSAAQAAGVDPDMVNRALLAATAWASEVTEYWE